MWANSEEPVPDNVQARYIKREENLIKEAEKMAKETLLNQEVDLDQETDTQKIQK